MSAKQRSHLYHWEQELIDAYHDYKWHLVLDPLYEKFQNWKTGEVSHLEMDENDPRNPQLLPETVKLFHKQT